MLPRVARPSLPHTLHAFPLLVCLIWGGNVVAARYTVAHLSALDAATLRGILATAVLLGWVLADRGRRSAPLPPLAPLLWISLIVTAHFVLLYGALAATTAGHVAVLLYLYPVFTSVLAHLWLDDDRMSLRRAIAVSLGFAGAATTISDSARGIGESSILGDALAVGSALAWAAGTTYTKRVLSTVDPVPLALYPTAISTAWLCTYVAIRGFSGSVPLDAATIAALAYQGVLVGAVSKVAWLALLRRYPASSLSSYTFLIPGFGVLAGILALGEPVSFRVVFGLALVAAALLTLRPGPGRSCPRSIPQARGDSGRRDVPSRSVCKAIRVPSGPSCER